MKIMNIENFLKNPTGKYSSSFARRDLIIQNLEKRFHDLIRKTTKFSFKVYVHNGDYIFKFKVPSEKFLDNLLYDVVISFIPIGNATQFASLNNYAVTVFSNSPNFMFTYAYVYNQDKILIPFLKDKLSKECLTKPPVIKNPEESYGFEKSVYFALLYIKENRYIMKGKLTPFLNNFNMSSIKNDILHSDRKLKEYNMNLDKEREEKKKEKKKLIKDNNKKNVDSKGKRILNNNKKKSKVGIPKSPRKARKSTIKRK